MRVDDIRVALIRPGTHRRLDYVREPPIQELLNGRILRWFPRPLFEISDRRGNLFLDRFSSFAVKARTHGFAVAIPEQNASFPPAVRPLADISFVFASFSHVSVGT